MLVHASPTHSLTTAGRTSHQTTKPRAAAAAAAASTSKPALLSIPTMEAPLHQFPVPPPLPQDALLRQQAVAARALMVAATAGNKAAGREQCPRCASRDTKFCYYNNYNTAQPRHFCRACRRYWTLGGSLRNVPVGGSTRKRPRPRPARHTRAMAAAAFGAAAMATPSTTTTASDGGSPFASPATFQGVGGGGGLLLSSLLLGSVSASSSASPLLALGAAPLLEGRLGFDLGFGDAALGGGGGGGAHAADLPHHHQLPLGGGPPLLPWPAATTRILEGDRAETTTVFPFPPAGAVWQELAATAPVVEAAGLHHGGAPHLLL